MNMMKSFRYLISSNAPPSRIAGLILELGCDLRGDGGHCHLPDLHPRHVPELLVLVHLYSVLYCTVLYCTVL